MLENIIRKRIQESKNDRDLAMNASYSDFIDTPIEIESSQWDHVNRGNYECLERIFSFSKAKLLLFFLVEAYKIFSSHNHYPDMLTSEFNIKVRLYTKNINDVTDVDIMISKSLAELYDDIKELRG